MGAMLTRKELYDLVWLEPLTTIARKFGVSYSAVGKACQKVNIPRPGAGYLAKLKAGKQCPKTLLPLRLPESDTVYIGKYLGTATKDEKLMRVSISRPSLMNSYGLAFVLLILLIE